MIMSETPDTPTEDGDDSCENKNRDNPLRIVRRADDGDGELDLGLDETEIDRRYGREDIADK